jgi:hypothetical protein
MSQATTKPPVDIFPLLRLVPERFAEWKRDCKNLREMQLQLMEKLLTPVKERMAKGRGNGSYMETVYEKAGEWNLDDETIMFVDIFVSPSSLN